MDKFPYLNANVSLNVVCFKVNQKLSRVSWIRHYRSNTKTGKIKVRANNIFKQTFSAFQYINLVLSFGLPRQLISLIGISIELVFMHRALWYQSRTPGPHKKFCGVNSMPYLNMTAVNDIKVSHYCKDEHVDAVLTADNGQISNTEEEPHTLPRTKKPYSNLFLTCQM